MHVDFNHVYLKLASGARKSVYFLEEGGKFLVVDAFELRIQKFIVRDFVLHMDLGADVSDECFDFRDLGLRLGPLVVLGSHVHQVIRDLAVIQVPIIRNQARGIHGEIFLNFVHFIFLNMYLKLSVRSRLQMSEGSVTVRFSVL